MRRSGDRAPRAIAAPTAAAPSMTSTTQMSVPANRCGIVIGKGAAACAEPFSEWRVDCLFSAL
jgi:hypothetical protein